jgi:hypothetical protein
VDVAGSGSYRNAGFCITTIASLAAATTEPVISSFTYSNFYFTLKLLVMDLFYSLPFKDKTNLIMDRTASLSPYFMFMEGNIHGVIMRNGE